MKCSQCGAQVERYDEECRGCDGTGDDGTLDSMVRGCVSCGGRGTIAVYECECRYEDEP